jgi:hypothetical protein
LIASIVASRLSWATITPLGVPVVPDVKIKSQTSAGRGGGHVATAASAAGSFVRSAMRSSTVVVGKSPSPAPDGSGASWPVPTIRRFGPARATIPPIASVLIRRSSGTRISPARIAPM